MTSVVPHHRRQLRRRWPGLLAGGAAGIALFFLGRLSAPEVRPAESPADAPAAGSSGQPNLPAERVVRSVPRLAAPAHSEACAQATDQDRKDTATFVVDRLFGVLEVFAHNPMFSTAESRANQLRPFVHGLAEGIRQTRPDLLKALAEDFNERLCQDGGMSDDKTILLSYLATHLPEMVDNRGLDCFFTRANGKEDASLWHMLDAWRGTGLPKTAALARVQASASDQRTIRRFMTPEEESAAVAVEANSLLALSGEQSAALPIPAPSGQQPGP
jgi:hypothetical protein